MATTSSTYCGTTIVGEYLYINGNPVGQVVGINGEDPTSDAVDDVGADGDYHTISLGGWQGGWHFMDDTNPAVATITIEELDQMKKEISENREMIQRVLGQLKEANKKLSSGYDRKNPIDDLEI